MPLGKPIAFHPVRRHSTPSRAYWIVQAIGAWLILHSGMFIFVGIALAVSVYTTNQIVIFTVSAVLSLPLMVYAHSVLARRSLASERRRLGLEDT